MLKKGAVVTTKDNEQRLLQHAKFYDKCTPGIPHAKLCGPVPVGGGEYLDDECACGCSAYGDYCLEPNNTGC